MRRTAQMAEVTIATFDVNSVSIKACSEGRLCPYRVRFCCFNEAAVSCYPL